MKAALPRVPNSHRVRNSGAGFFHAYAPQRLATVVVLVVACVLAACSADPPCALGTRGWCENEMAALALRTSFDRLGDSAVDVIIVEEGFAVDLRRYGATPVRGVKPDQLEAAIAASSRVTGRIVVVVSNVQALPPPGYGAEAAQGTASVTLYQNGQLLRSESVRGVLINGAWIIADQR